MGLGDTVGDGLAALAAELERFAQAGLAGVEPIDDLLQPLDRGLIGLRLLAHPSLPSRSISAPTPPSAKRSLTRPAPIAAAPLVTGSPAASSASPYPPAR